MTTAALCLFLGALPQARDAEETRVKREEIFEFARKPVVTRSGDRVEIAFASRGWCDVTVAIEDAAGRIVRHLASGVLGPNAPEPLQKNTREQKIVWNGKDDRDQYIDDKASLTVRVSLGLKPEFERTLYAEPKKRISHAVPIIRAAEEGVYVFEGSGVDRLGLFDHEGNYVKTVYPFPADKLEKVAGLRWRDFPDGRRLPLKNSMYQQTLLTSGANASEDDRGGMFETAAMAMAVRNGRLALAYMYLNRLASDGSSGGLPLRGPKTGFLTKWDGFGGAGGGNEMIGPSSAAFSPDGKWLYLTGYMWVVGYGGTVGGHALHGVFKLAFEEDAEPQVFAGRMTEKDQGAGNDRLHVPTSVACDRRGRVYVSDYMNDRVQVFLPDGTHAATLPTNRPAKVMIHEKTGEIYVFSWPVVSEKKIETKNLKPTLTRFGPAENPKPLEVVDLAFVKGGGYGLFAKGQQFEVEMDSWTDPPTFWVAGAKHAVTRADVKCWGQQLLDNKTADPWKEAGIALLFRKDGAWQLKRDFGAETVSSVVRARPPTNQIQRLDVNPKNGKLYLGEADSGPTGKSSRQLLEIDPETGKVKIVDLPFNAMEFAFDLEGSIYLRSTYVVARYDPQTWREIPWDYGEELPAVGDEINGKYTAVVAGLRLPSASPVCFHQGGMSVSPKGHLVVSCGERGPTQTRKDELKIPGGSLYHPRVYPGRVFSSTSPCIHVWDKHGKLLYEDAVPGIGQIDGLWMDRDDGLYVMATPSRLQDGKEHYNIMSE